MKWFKTVSTPITALLIAASLAAPLAAQSPQDPTSAAIDQAFSDAKRIKASDILSVAAWMYQPDPDGELQESYRLSYTEFNPEGNPLVQNIYSQDGSMAQDIAYTYDQEGFLTESFARGIEPIGEVRTRYRYENANLKETASYTPDGELIVKTIHEYDGDGHVQESITYTPGNKLYVQILFRYDDEGNMTEAITYDADGNIKGRAINEFNDEKTRINNSRYSTDAGITSRVASVYDDAGRLTTVRTYGDKSAVITETTHRYDDDNRIIESETQSPAARTSFKMTFSYDGKGDLVRATTYNKLGKIVSQIRYRYQYHQDSTEPGIEQN